MNNLAPYDINLPQAAEWPSPPHRAEPSSLRYWIGVVLSRGWKAIGVAVLLFGAVVGIASQIPRTYYAEATVLVQPSRANLAQVDQNQTGLPSDTSAIDTEVEMLKSRALSESVVEKLGLDKDVEFNPSQASNQTSKWQVEFIPKWPFVLVGSTNAAEPMTVGVPARVGKNETFNPPLSSKWQFGFISEWPFVTTGLTKAAEPMTVGVPARVIDEVQRRTFARRVGLTYVVRVGFSSNDPAKAEKITNALIDNYLTRQVAGKVKLVAQANEILDASVGKLRQNALVSAANAQEYKNAHALLSTEGATMLEGEISTLNKEISQAKADSVQKQVRLSAELAQGGRGNGGANIGAALNSDTIKELRKKEAEISSQFAQLSVQFKPDYPETKRAQAQLVDVQDQIEREINRIHSSLTADARAASQREASLIASRSQAQQSLGSNNRSRVGLVALELRADAAKRIYEGYLNRASEVAAARSLQQADATVNYRAAVSTSPPWPDMRLAVVGGALLALLGATLVVLLPEFWNRRLRSSRDIERGIGMPLAAALPDLASISHGRRIRGSTYPADFLVVEPLTAFAESFRNLRAFLTLADRSEPSKIIAITSAVPREGKSMTSLCLAQTLAQTGAKVIVVDCDLRQRGITKRIGKFEVGIVEVVEKNLPLAEALICDSKSGFWILPVADGQAVPHDLFSKKEADELFRNLAARFDYVILDTPPLLGVADARVLAVKADKVLFVVHWNKTPASAVRAAVDILQECGAKVVGAILSKVNIRQQARYGYSDSSDYFHYYRRYYGAAA